MQRNPFHSSLGLVDALSVCRLLILIVTAVFIFWAIHRGDARYQISGWFGAFLVVIGASGAIPSTLAAVHHMPFVFVSIVWPRGIDPRVAVTGYTMFSAVGVTLLLLAGRKPRDTGG